MLYHLYSQFFFLSKFFFNFFLFESLFSVAQVIAVSCLKEVENDAYLKDAQMG